MEISERPEPLRSPVATGLRRRFVVAVPPGRTAWLHAGETTATPRLLDGTGNPQPFDDKATRVDVPTADRLIALPQGPQLVVLAMSAGPPGSRWLLLKEGNTWHAYLKLPEKAGEAPVDVNVWVAVQG